MPGSPSSSSFFAAQGGGASLAARSFAKLFGSDASAPKNLRLLADDTDRFLRQVWVPSVSNLQFQIDGVPFQASYEPGEKGVKLQVWSILGYLPYSVESAQRRRMLMTILEGMHSLPRAKFGMNRENQIVVTLTIDVHDSIKPPAFIFVPLLSFLQEAMPFVRLIGECL